MGKLAGGKINVTAVDAVTCGEGRYGAILWVKASDAKKTVALLGHRGGPDGVVLR